MAYGAKRNRSQNQDNTNLNTNSFRQINNNQDFTSGGIGWQSGKDIPKYWTSTLGGEGRDFSIDSGYSEWSPGNLINIGDTTQDSTEPTGLDVGAASRYCYQWTRVGGVVTGSGRVQLGYSGGSDGTSATWLKWSQSNGSEGLYTSYDKTDIDRNSGSFSVATIPLPVYYQTNVGQQSGVPVTPPMGNKADGARELNTTTAAALGGVRKNYISSNDVYLGGAGTVVGQFWNDIGDENYEYVLKYANGDTATSNMKPPSGNVTGTVNFNATGGISEIQNNTFVARYMVIVVKALQVPNGGSANNPSTNLRNYSGPSNGYPNSQFRYILPPMYHFTFSYVLSGYTPNVNIS